MYMLKTMISVFQYRAQGDTKAPGPATMLFSYATNGKIGRVTGVS
jgi:hypothetical protein